MNLSPLNGSALNGPGSLFRPIAPDTSVLGAFYRAYTANPALAFILPTLAVGTVHPGTPLPWGVVTKIHDLPAHASGGTRVDSMLVQISVFSSVEDELNQIANAIRAMLPPTVNLPIAGGTVLGVFVTDDRMMAEPPANSVDTYTFANHQTYRILVSHTN